jgi:tight adherence protein C
MQLYLVGGCIAVSVAMLVLFIAQLVPARSPAISRGLAEIEEAAYGPGETLLRRRRQARAERLRVLLEAWGEKVAEGRRDLTVVRQQLLQAGYISPKAVPIFWGIRFFSLLAFGLVGLVVLSAASMSFLGALFGAIWFATLGWVAPSFYIGRLVKIRQQAIVRALPDALDTMVVCVEAGLALNQAILRVSEEIGHVCPIMAEQLELVNLEIRAGTGREDALRNLADRTGVADMRSFVTMLIQTDRFGTSIAQALRTHADTMRTKRRQRAEEAAAKTTIKLVFPLVFFVFPAMFAVILVPALIQIFRTLAGFK